MIVAVEAKDLLIILLMMNYLTTECLGEEPSCEPKIKDTCQAPNYCASSKQRCKAGETRIRNACRKMENGKWRPCGCCVKGCEPKDKDTCKTPNYCVSPKQKCKKGETRIRKACRKMVSNDKTGIKWSPCGCCKVIAPESRSHPKAKSQCPSCGLRNPQPPPSKDDGTADTLKRIAGGVEIEPPHKYPWLVLIKITIGEKAHHCGGQIINERYVLTAAHCAFNGIEKGCKKWENVIVYVGMHRSDLSDAIPKITRPINASDFIVHDEYDCGRMHHDIALIRLEEQLDLQSTFQKLGIGAICLPKDEDKEYYSDDNIKGVAAGWGATYATKLEKNRKNKKVPQDVPSEVTIPIGMDLCSRYPPSMRSDNILCAGDSKQGKDACGGDSGGPLVIQNKNGTYELVGVTSFGPRNGNCNGPGAYTRVNQYMDWIKESTKDVPCNILHAD